MSKSYAQLQKQIEVLQQQADQMRQKEIQGVVTRIKEAIQAYGLTASDLGLKAGVGAQAKSLFKRRRGGPKATKRGKAKGAPVAKFRDDAGNVWGGRGPRPRWLRDALAAGRTLQEFAA